MSTTPHPAPPAGGDDLPSLTLVLPSGLSHDQVLAGLAEAVTLVRLQLATRARTFTRRAGQYAADGNQLAQALYHGEALGSEHAVAAIDEAIVEAFGLWEQYWPQVSPEDGPAASTVPPKPLARHPAHDRPLAARHRCASAARACRHDQPCR